jgi:hypothetical protein
LWITSSASLYANEPWENSIQLGVEYDDNVFKTFNAGQEDGLLRLLVKTQKKISGADQQLQTSLQLGGKKYFIKDEQDTAIGQLDLDWLWALNESVHLSASNVVKGQIENSNQDAGLSDINEDFLADNLKLQLSYPLFGGIQQTIQGKLGWFDFYGDLPIDDFDERIGTTFSYNFEAPFTLKVGYEFSATQFTSTGASERDDKQHEISSGFSYYGPVLLSLGYAYSDTSSSQDVFSSSGHRVSLLFSMALHSTNVPEGKVEDITLHLLGSLQIRRYPAIFISDEEGQRFLFSDSEENNFNTLTVKVTKRLTNNLTAELKFSRYSNELSDREASFERNLIMLGMRATF